MKRYNPSEIEPKWQKVWGDQKTYKAHDDSDKPKYYALSFFPYPSGIGLHIGHVRNFAITDVAARFKRMQGFEVLHPMGYDSFGLPAENYAIKTGVPPKVTTKQNTENFKSQAINMGLSIDWDREFASSDPDYYKWTQWFFLLLYKKGLAYQKESLQFWCETDKTVLANEQVEAGKCWRCGNEVTKKSLNQWFFKITDYADRLEADLNTIDWPHGIKTMQRNWIGRSKGAEVRFAVEHPADAKVKDLTVFTTRPDTLFGATFLVVAPEHDAAKKLATNGQRGAVEAYIRQAETKTDLDRMDQSREKTGVFTGSYAINPVNGQKLPIWIADYVLVGYGTGAVMAVPAHDERDNQFAKKFDLPIIEVVEPQFGEIQGDEHHKQAVIAIVRNPQNGKVLVLDWGPRRKNWGGTMFVGGGTGEGEDPVEAARREIAEETGYTHVRHIKTAPTYIHNYYFSNVKNRNDHARILPILFELENEEQAERSLDDNEDQFTVAWLPEAKVAATISEEAHAHGYELLTSRVVYHGEGVMVNSGDFDGLASSDAREKITQWLADHGAGKERTTYKLRDWLISRQRYWGAPIPMIHCQKDGIVPVPEDQLPVVLPDMEHYQPTGDGRSPLANNREWVEVACPKCGGPAERETDTMDGFACSSWYALRFADPHNTREPFSRELVEKWTPVDLYVGGAEHAVMHLLYARMWTKVMFDDGLIGFDEPFTVLRNQGMLVAADGRKFSKSAGNGVDPDDIITNGYGADALRTVILFLAPFDQKTPWSPEALGGIYRFLNRVWTLAQEVLGAKGEGNAESTEIRRVMHKTIQRVTTDMHKFGYNTAIAALMEATNDLYKLRTTAPLADHAADWKWAVSGLAQLLAPFAPHIAEELWSQCGRNGSVHLSDWPAYDEAYVVEDMVTVAVQVNGKVRAELQLPAGITNDHMQAAALANERVQEFTQGAEPKRVIVVPGKLVNIVV